MPRISNSETVIDYLKDGNLLTICTPDEALRKGPFDLCSWCFDLGAEVYKPFLIDHPPYEGVYNCFLCLIPLSAEDDL